MTTLTEPMRVERIETDAGSHIEPPCDDSWSDLDRLRWKAAVASLSVGCDVIVYESVGTTNGRPISGEYGFMAGSTSGGSYPFLEMWTFLSGMATGADCALLIRSGWRPLGADEPADG